MPDEQLQVCILYFLGDGLFALQCEIQREQQTKVQTW